MASPTAPGTRQIQEGYRPVPISEDDRQSPLRLCVIVRDDPDPAAGIFVLLRDAVDASIYLGCLVDAGGWVHEWIELWIQNVSHLGAMPDSSGQILTNIALDEQWKRRAAVLSRLDRSGSIEIPAASSHPLPIFFDLAVTRPMPLREGAAPWELCTDDRLLVEHDLPPYGASLARYLTVRGSGKPPFVPAVATAPENDATQTLMQAFPALIPLNPDGGLMMVRKLAPLSFENYLGLLAGSEWTGVEQGSKAFKFAGVYATLGNSETTPRAGGHLFLGRRGRAGHLAETFHLKLGLLRQAFCLVRDYIREEQTPFLNLSADAFRVSLADTGRDLPFFWTAKVSLSSPASALPLPAGGGPGRWIAPGRETSIYCPAAGSPAVRATGWVQITQITAEPEGVFVIEGGLSTQERIGTSPADLLWFRLPLPVGRIDFYATLSGESGPGIQRFRTLPRKLDQYQESALRSAGGTAFAAAAFETLTVQGSPLDLHALAVLGVRALLVNEETTLPAALDQLLALAGALPAGPPETLGDRIRSTVAADSRRAEALGPRRLLKSGSLTCEEASAYLPAELWWDAVALLIRCLPGAAPDSFCASFLDAPESGIDAIFEPAIQALERLSMRARSLLFADWKYGTEVRSALEAVLRRHLEETG